MNYIKTCAFLLLVINVCYANFVIDIHLMSYEDKCIDSGGGACDPRFTFCVTRPNMPNLVLNSNCWYDFKGETNTFEDHGFIDFSSMTFIKGIKNPWRIKLNIPLFEPSVKLVWRVKEDNPFKEGTKQIVLAAIVLDETKWPSEQEAKYVLRESKFGDHILKFKIRIYCFGDMYGPTCSVHCAPPSGSNKYICNKTTGEKECPEGWTGGLLCNEDIDECSQGICQHGECTNQLGSYTCQNCHSGYTGPDCDQLVDPCTRTPCENNGDCVASSDHSTFQCKCVYPYTGSTCQQIETTITPTTTTATTTITTTTATEPTTEITSPTEPPSITTTNKETSPQPPTTPSIATTNKETSPPPTASTVDNPTTKPPGHQDTTAEPGHHTVQTDRPVAAASTASSTEFPAWIIVVVALLIIMIIGTIIIVRFCRRRHLNRKQSINNILIEPIKTCNGEAAHYENSAYNAKVTTLPSEPSAPKLDDFQANVSRVEMEEDGYLTASNVQRDGSDALTPNTRRRAASNPYINFDHLGQGTLKHPIGGDEPEEQHYHDLDETAMAVKDMIRPLSATDEGAYGDVPSNLPSRRRQPGNHYDTVDFRPSSRQLPKLPNDSGDGDDTKPKHKSTFSEPVPHKKTFPSMMGKPLKRTDPFASKLHCDEDLPHIDLTNRPSQRSEYETQRNQGQGHSKQSTLEGGYETPTGDGFYDNGHRVHGDYEVPSRSSVEYATPQPKKNRPPVTTKPTLPPQSFTNNSYQNDEDEDDIPFPAPPPPLTDNDISMVESNNPRPLSFHEGQTKTGNTAYDDDDDDGDDDDGDDDDRDEDDVDNDGVKTRRNNLNNPAFVNPLFGGEGPGSNHSEGNSSNQETKENNRYSRPISFHPGMTDNASNDDDDGNENDEENVDKDGNSKADEKRRENDGFMNPLFGGNGPGGREGQELNQNVPQGKGISSGEDKEGGREGDEEDGAINEGDLDGGMREPNPSTAAMPALYMKNLLFEMDMSGC